MNEIANTTTQSPATLEALATQARVLRMSITTSMWELARVFVEAKALVPHGQWQSWLAENADVSVRTAEDMIASFQRFGGRAPFEKLGPAKTFKLLPLPEGTEERFMAEHDVDAMSTREIQAAVKQARAEAQAEIEAERRARMDAGRRAEAAEAQTGQPPEELIDRLREQDRALQAQDAEIRRLADIGTESLNERNRLQGENRRLQQENQDYRTIIEEQQADIRRAQEELLNTQSAMAKGDAERVPCAQLTAETFGQAVRAFIGAVARMPHMGAAFSHMASADRQEYDLLLTTVEKWAADSRRALNTVSIDGEASRYA